MGSVTKKGSPLLVTIVRHGESKDNLRAVWAGWTDSPLSAHGRTQAARLGVAFKDTPITTIYTSDLLRARETAQAIFDASTVEGPKPTFVVSPILREQYFGDVEGLAWDKVMFAAELNGKMPWEAGRSDVIANKAESLEHVAHRAEIAVRHIIAPHVVSASTAEEGTKAEHIVIVAHGLFLAELVYALKRVESADALPIKSVPYQNTGWGRFELSLADTAPLPASTRTSPYAVIPTSDLLPHASVLPPQLPEGELVPALIVTNVVNNDQVHLEGLVRDKNNGDDYNEEMHSEIGKRMKALFAGKSGGHGAEEKSEEVKTLA